MRTIKSVAWLVFCSFPNGNDHDKDASAAELRNPSHNFRLQGYAVECGVRRAQSARQQQRGCLSGDVSRYGFYWLSRIA